MRLANEIFQIIQWEQRTRLQYKADSGLIGLVVECFYPLVVCMIILFVFKYAFLIEDSEFLGIVMIKYLLWHFFSKSLSEGSHVFIHNRSVIKNFKTPLQKMLLGFLIFKVEIFSGCFLMALIILFAGFLQFSLYAVCLMGYSMFIIFIWIWSALNIVLIYRIYTSSVAKWLEPCLIILFWLSPVFYSHSAMPADFKLWIHMNPFSWLFIVFENVSQESSNGSNIGYMLATSVFSILFFIKSLHFFTKHEKEMIHIL